MTSSTCPTSRGATDDDVTFAVGWVSAQDRGLLFEQARYNARAPAVDAPGLDASGDDRPGSCSASSRRRSRGRGGQAGPGAGVEGREGPAGAPRHRRVRGGGQRIPAVRRDQHETRHPDRHLRPQRPEGPVRGSGRRQGDAGLHVPERPPAVARPEQGKVGVQRPPPEAPGRYRDIRRRPVSLRADPTADRGQRDRGQRVVQVHDRPRRPDLATAAGSQQRDHGRAEALPHRTARS